MVFHSLRHSSTTYKLNHGDLKATQGDTGHAQIDMITDVYSHILDEDRKVNAQNLRRRSTQTRTCGMCVRRPIKIRLRSSISACRVAKQSCVSIHAGSDTSSAKDLKRRISKIPHFISKTYAFISKPFHQWKTLNPCGFSVFWHPRRESNARPFA